MQSPQTVVTISRDEPLQATRTLCLKELLQGGCRSEGRRGTGFPEIT